MASGDTLATFFPRDNEPPAANYATETTRNLRPILEFDTTTGEAAVFTGILPRNYAGGGITVYVHHAAASATTGTIGWTVAFEDCSDGALDLDGDGFAAAQTITAATVPATAGIEAITNVAVTNGANMDSIAVGRMFRLKLIRDVANDDAAGDAHFFSMELKET